MSPLDLPLRSPMRLVDESILAPIRNMTQAIQQCKLLGGFDDDKPLCAKLGIDDGQWSRIMNINSTNRAHFPHEKYELLFDVCGNEVPLFWLAYRRGYELRQKETELEKQLHERDARIKALEDRLGYAESLLRGR